MWNTGGGVTEALAVDQFVPTLMPRDAVGNHTLQTQRALLEAGVPGGIWSVVIDPECSQRANVYTDWKRNGRSAQRVLLYQAASVSGGIVDFLLRHREPKSICYHNLTPAEFFDGWDEGAARSLRDARTELTRLASEVRVAIADSEYNAKDLRSLGVEDVIVAPPFLGSSLTAAPHAALLESLRSQRGLRILFVSRIAPSKGHAHLIRTIAAVRAGVDPDARLYLVGPPGPPAYVRAVTELADRICPDGVIMTGAVPDDHLAAYYRAADVFLCMSEHEGFGIPLVEGMRMDVPIVALDTTAVGETLGGAGVILRRPDAALAAEVIGRIHGDAELREALLKRQRQRAVELEEFPRTEAIIRAVMGAAQA